MTTIPAYLLSETACERLGMCPGCPEAVKQAPTGRWFITMGHPGFNSRANNLTGYASKKVALAVLAMYRRA